MPVGRYTILADGGEPVGTEEFRCAPGPMGWRSFSEVETSQPTQHHETIDVAVDASWHIARVRIATGEHEILLEPREGGTVLAGSLDGEPIQVPYGPEFHLDYCTPVANAITARRLLATAELDVVYLEPVTLQPSLVRQGYERIGDEPVATPVGTFEAIRWRYTDLGSAWTADLWVAGDIVVRYEHLFELAWYDPGASGPRLIA
jgi:hypothetical protein